MGGAGHYDEPLPDVSRATAAPEPLAYRFDIEPPHGVSDFRFGMPEAEVIPAAVPLGTCVSTIRGWPGPSLVVLVRRPFGVGLGSTMERRKSLGEGVWPAADRTPSSGSRVG